MSTSEPLQRSTASEGHQTSGGMKPKVLYRDFIGTWDEAFTKVKVLKEGERLGCWKVIEVHVDPDWVWLRKKKEKRMVRRGDQLLVELVASTFG